MLNILEENYGLEPVSISKIHQGIGDVYQVETDRGTFVLKGYGQNSRSIQRSLRGNAQAGKWGIPIALEVPNCRGDLVTKTLHGSYILYHFINGKTVKEGEFSHTAAANLGRTIGMLQNALKGIDSEGLVGDHRWEISIAGGHRRLVAKLREGEEMSPPYKAVTTQYMSSHLKLYTAHTKEMTCVEKLMVQWVHGDCNPGNFLFDESDRVAAVIDFDNLSYLPRGFDFMYAQAQSFSEPGDLLRGALWAYLDEVQPTREEVASYPGMWLFSLFLNIWPWDALYKGLDEYTAVWESYNHNIKRWIRLLPDMNAFFVEVYDAWQHRN